MSFDANEWKYRWCRLEQWWRQWPVRQWVNQHPRLVVGMATVSTLLLLIVVVSMLIGGESAEPVTSDQAWFYDLNTGKLFAVSASKVPPVATPSGPTPDGAPAGVRAYVVTYGSGGDRSEPTVAYLETRAPDTPPSAYHAAHQHFGAEWGKGLLVRRVDDPEWVPADSPTGRAIIERAHQPDDQGRMPEPYLP
ncbi:MAG TPA: hypothetical protein ENN87_07770 [Phycisphaerales bacterium]|nr:hypothetical protein [Phycisphaerales bacterium]